MELLTTCLRYACGGIDDPAHPADSIVYRNLCGWFRRAVQVKKDAVVDGVEKMIVSGRVKYDAFGRPVRSYYPMVDELSNSTVFKRIRTRTKP